MAHSEPYKKRPRNNAIAIINPETMKEINAGVAAQTISAATTSEGSPAPSEAASVTEVNEVKDEIVSKDEPAVEISVVTLEEDKPEEVVTDGAIPDATSSSEVGSTASAAAAPEPVVVGTPVSVSDVAPKEKAAY